jgi:hypothetical protein
MLMPSEDGKSQMKSLTMEFILSVVLFYNFFASLFLFSRNCGACHKAVEIKMRRKEKNLQQCKKRKRNEKSLHFAKFISRNANNIYTHSRRAMMMMIIWHMKGGGRGEVRLCVKLFIANEKI